MDVLADDLIPNYSLRDAITHILKSTATSTTSKSTSSDNGGSVVHVASIESTRPVHSKAPSSSRAAASKDDQRPSSSGQSKSTLESVNIKETTSPDGLLAPQEVPEKSPENKQATNVLSGANEDHKSEGCYTTMPSAPLACGRYMAPFGAGTTPFTGYPFGTTFDRMLSQNQFAAQFRMLSAVLPRELSELAVNNVGVNSDEEIGGDSPSAKRPRPLAVSRYRFSRPGRSQTFTNFDRRLDHKQTNLDRYDGHSDRAPEKPSKRSRSSNDHEGENGCSNKKGRLCSLSALSELPKDERNIYRTLKEPYKEGCYSSKGRTEEEDEEDRHFKRKPSWSSSVISCS